MVLVVSFSKNSNLINFYYILDATSQVTWPRTAVKCRRPSATIVAHSVTLPASARRPLPKLYEKLANPFLVHKRNKLSTEAAKTYFYI